MSGSIAKTTTSQGSGCPELARGSAVGCSPCQDSQLHTLLRARDTVIDTFPDASIPEDEPSEHTKKQRKPHSSPMVDSQYIPALRQCRAHESSRVAECSRTRLQTLCSKPKPRKTINTLHHSRPQSRSSCKRLMPPLTPSLVTSMWHVFRLPM